MTGRPVTYGVVAQPDGTLSARITIEPDKTYARDGFKTYVEVACWVEGLRALMAACGAPRMFNLEFDMGTGRAHWTG